LAKLAALLKARWREAVAVGVLVLVPLAVFSSVLHAELVQWDDDINIYANPHIRELNWNTVRWMFTDTSYTPRYRPLNWMSWAVLYHWFGPKGAPFHVALLAVHIVNGVLVFVLVLKLLKGPSPEERSWWRIVCAAAGALIWAIHPLRAEVVGSANGQMYTQSLLFLLVSLLLYLRAIEKQDDAMRSTPYRLSVIFFVLSLLTYPTAIGFFVVLLALDIWVFRRLPEDPLRWLEPAARPVLRQNLPFLAVTLLVSLVALWSRLHATEMWASLSQTEGFGWGSRVAQAGYIWSYFLWKPLVPLRLSPVYTQLVSFRPTDPQFLASAALIVVLTTTLIRLRHRWPGALAAWVSHLALMVPMLGLTDHPHYPNDRYGYIVGVVWAVCVGSMLWSIKPVRALRMAALSGVAALTVCLAVLSFRQVRIWQNSVTLFQGVIARLGDDPYRADIYWRLALVYAHQNQVDEAIGALSEATRIHPDFPQAQNDLAALLLREGKVDEAVAHYQTVFLAHPTAQAHLAFGNAVASLGRIEEALSHFLEATRLNPNLVEAHIACARALAQLGRDNEAQKQYRDALERANASGRSDLAAQIEAIETTRAPSPANPVR
jgi:Tfp pilus assembly protein PilF